MAFWEWNGAERLGLSDELYNNVVDWLDCGAWNVVEEVKGLYEIARLDDDWVEWRGGAHFDAPLFLFTLDIRLVLAT